MKIAVASDHGGFDFKSKLVDWLVNDNIEVIDSAKERIIKVNLGEPFFIDKEQIEIQKIAVDKNKALFGDISGLSAKANTDNKNLLN